MLYDRSMNKTTMLTETVSAITFDQFVAETDARNNIQLNVTKWTLMLCDALRQNYIDYSIRNHRRSIERLEGNTDTGINYHLKYIDELKAGNCEYSFVIESGTKYHKIIMVIDNGPGRSPSRSVHAFINRKTGEVYKSASWKSPAKGVRFDLRIINQREWLFENADWAGSYLYLK
jgi:hypothetical protein